MKSELTPDFIKCFKKLPENIRELAGKKYTLWKNHPLHPSLNFKKIMSTKNIFSVRIGIGYRALGRLTDDEDLMIWFWIGSHSDYDNLISKG